MKFRDKKGESVAESAVLLALIVIVATAILVGVAHHSRDRLANVNSGFDQQGGAGTAAGAAARPAPSSNR